MEKQTWLIVRLNNWIPNHADKEKGVQPCCTGEIVANRAEEAEVTNNENNKMTNHVKKERNQQC